MKSLIVFNLVLLYLVLSVNGNERPGKRHYCTKTQLKEVMELTCINSFQKRSLFYPSASLKANKLSLFKKVFNIDDNKTTSIPEINFQMRLLFGPCHDRQRQSDIENLMEIYKNRDFHKNPTQEITNDRLNSFLNYDSNDESAQPVMRYKRGIIEDCCNNPCSLKEINKYCPLNDE